MEDHIWCCILKRLAGNETIESERQLDEWLSESQSHQQKYQELKALWDLTGLLKQEENNDPFPFISAEESYDLPVKSVKKFNLFNYAMAASLIGVVFFGFYQLTRTTEKNYSETFLTKKANYGEIVKVLLPDSSKVWLNAGSEIKFSSKFTTSKVRKVVLKGEAYFEVSHDKSHPFLVESAGVVTTVYGTSFSVRAYPNEHLTSVSVNSGRVGVWSSAIENTKAVMLLPNDQLIYNSKLQSFSKKEIKKEDVASWINGDLKFEQTPLVDVLESLSRKFNVTFNMGQVKSKDCKLTASFQNQSLKTVLKTLEMLMNISSKQINQTIYLEGGEACTN